MAAPISIFTSSSSERRWVNQITKTLNPEKEDTIIDIDVCIFQLPKTLTSVNPEAFAPRRMGLGPYHHLRPDLHKMERKKLAAAKRVLRASPIGDAQKLLIQEIKESELVIRGFYDQYIDLDGDTIAWIFAIDGLLLFDHLNSRYSYRNPNIGPIGEAERKAAQDIMMLENQIPLFFLFKLMGKFIRLEPDNSFVDPYDDTEKVDEIECLDDTEIGFLLYDFVAQHSPLYLCVKGFFKPNTNIVHLLDYMYHLIVNNRGHRAVKMAASYRVDLIEGGKKIASAAEQVLGLAGVSPDVVKPFQLIQSLPWQEILTLFKKSDQIQSSSSVVEEIVIPSASQLSTIAGINFSKTIGGIRDIKFEEENRTMYLPVIRLYVDSEVILRNLIAYEASMGFKSLELAEYVDFMCGIVDTVEDVKLLREKGIIHEEGLSNEEIAKLFNGISKSSGNGKLEKMIEKVNEEYENTARVKAYRSLKKYGYGSWKVLTFMATVVLVLLLILQSICQIYGCSTRFFGYQQTLSLAYAADS